MDLSVRSVQSQYIWHLSQSIWHATGFGVPVSLKLAQDCTNKTGIGQANLDVATLVAPR